MITKDHDDSFNFCKTARKPYDEIVTAILAVVDKLAPGALEIGSDGDESDWEEGLALAKKAGYGSVKVKYPVAKD